MYAPQLKPPTMPLVQPPEAPVQALGNDVPMQGDGFYNRNSGLQYAAMQRALPLLDSVPVTGTAAGVFSAVEYGCAQGLNSYVR